MTETEHTKNTVELVNPEMKKFLDDLHKYGKACIYSNKDAELFTQFLDSIYYPYTSEDVGGNSIAPEMWYFRSEHSRK